MVDFTTPYSPYTSFPKNLAIMIPDKSIKALPIPLPKTAQNESLKSLLLNKLILIEAILIKLISMNVQNYSIRTFLDINNIGIK